VTFPVLTDALNLLSSACAGAADRLDDPTPCPSWTVGQVLLHAAGDQHAWAMAVGKGTMPTYNPFDPPRDLVPEAAALIAAGIEEAHTAWAGVDPGDREVGTPLPPVPTLPAPLAAAACALDAAVHAWDVAVATGQPAPLSAELAGQLLPAARATAEPLRGFAYGPALPDEAGDDAVATLLRYLGRDPHWKP
jgi:uncharacterized protein (TIGR03086 family)